MRQLYYIRHGQTDDNKAHHWGHYETPLNDTGRQQAIQAGKLAKAKGLAFGAIVASPQPRAVETARLIATEIGFSHDKLKTMDELVERRMGPLCGQPYDDYFADGKVYRDLDGLTGIELLSDVQARAERALSQVRQQAADCILVVSHGAFGRAFHRAVMGLPYQDEYLTPQPHDIIDNATIFRLI